MAARDLFGVALRVLGIWFIYQALFEVLWIVFRINHIVRDDPGKFIAEDYQTVHISYAALYFVLAFFLLVAANGIVNLIYGDKPVTSPKP